MLTLHFVPYEEIRNLSSSARIEKMLDIVKEDKIVILDGKLTKEEEVALIRETMERVSDKFKGIEIQVWEAPGGERSAWRTFREKLAALLVPDYNEGGFTIIGPANIIKEIKKDPSKIQLVTQGRTPRRSR
jgi:hypothetical protein